MAKIIILDVGHGNCGLISTPSGSFIIDAPLGATLLDTLSDLSIDTIEAVFVSHADADHIGGVKSLLLSEKIVVKKLVINADSTKKTETWNDLRAAIRVARENDGTRVDIGLTTERNNEYVLEDVAVEIVYPFPELMLVASDGKDLKGRQLNSNATSAVIRILYKESPIALFAGDMENIALKNIVEDGRPVHSQILVFPHHGGLPGRADPKTFAQELCELVKPSFVIFSIDRVRHNNPRGQIIDGVKSAVPDTHIMCTQLSNQCSATTPDESHTHVSTLPALGKFKNSCCAGTLVFDIDEHGYKVIPDQTEHIQYIKDNTQSPLCRIPIKSVDKK